VTELPGGVAVDQVQQLVRSGASRNLSSSILLRLRLWLTGWSVLPTVTLTAISLGTLG
jgi:hypothetical protein